MPEPAGTIARGSAQQTPGGVAAAILRGPFCPDGSIFGRSILERLILACRRAGIRRLLIEGGDQLIQAEAQSLAHREGLELSLITSLSEAAALLPDPMLAAVIPGNLVMTPTQLSRLITGVVSDPDAITVLEGVAGAVIEAGPVSRLIAAERPKIKLRLSNEYPVAVSNAHDACRAAELTLARGLRHETAAKDAPMARWVDRRISWRISYRLTRTRITPNQVTILSTIFGLMSALLFALPGYWYGLTAALLFLVATTVDGVDGELARLKMVESRTGAQLDTLTDNLVHIALFAGIVIGSSRAGSRGIYLMLLALLLGGFVLCTLAGRRARNISRNQDWIAKLERLTGRDFAYILLLLAVINRIYFFAWGAALGTYVFAGVMWYLGGQQLKAIGLAERPSSVHSSIDDSVATGNLGLIAELAQLGRYLKTTRLFDQTNRSYGKILALLLVGAVVVTIMVYRVGPAEVGLALGKIGWRIGIIVAMELLVHLTSARAWWCLFPGANRRTFFGRLTSTYFAGTALNDITPGVPVGGDPFKAFALREHVSMTVTTATLLSAKLAQALARMIFAIAGMLIASRSLKLHFLPLRGLLIGFALVSLGLAIFALMQIRGIASSAKVLFRRDWLPQSWAKCIGEVLANVDRHLSELYQGRPFDFVASVGLVLAGLLIGVLQIGLLMRWMDIPCGWSSSVAIEALSVALAFALFAIPSSFGVQEGGKLLVFAALGLPLSAGLTVGLVFRITSLVSLAVGFVCMAWLQHGAKSAQPYWPSARAESSAANSLAADAGE